MLRAHEPLLASAFAKLNKRFNLEASSTRRQTLQVKFFAYTQDTKGFVTWATDMVHMAAELKRLGLSITDEEIINLLIANSNAQTFTLLRDARKLHKDDLEAIISEVTDDEEALAARDRYHLN